MGPFGRLPDSLEGPKKDRCTSFVLPKVVHRKPSIASSALQIGRPDETARISRFSLTMRKRRDLSRQNSSEFVPFKC